MNSEQKLAAIDEALKGSRKIRVTFGDGTCENIRIFRSTSGVVCRFMPRARRRGYLFDLSDVEAVYPIKMSSKPASKKWEDAWKKVRARLVKSGLWQDIIGHIDSALSIGYDTLQIAYDDYWKMEGTDFKAKYPNLCDGEAVNTTILWHISKMPRVKQMTFERRCYNDAILDSIRQSMSKKEACRKYSRYRYDVSFSYNPEHNSATYAEEFKNCGNGHYYLALDATHALFWEDD